MFVVLVLVLVVLMFIVLMVNGYSVGVHSVDVSVDGLGSVGSVILAGRILSQWSSSRRD